MNYWQRLKLRVKRLTFKTFEFTITSRDPQFFEHYPLEEIEAAAQNAVKIYLERVYKMSKEKGEMFI